MKKYLPFVSLLVFVTAELFWSRQLRSDSRSRAHQTRFSFPFAFPVFLLCCVYFLIYFGKDNNARQTWEKFLEDSPAVKWNITGSDSILALGVFLRFWKLDSLFDGITYDESYKGLDAIAIRYFGERPIFLDWNGGREALAAYLVAAAQYVFGISIFSVRFFPALFNCLALLFFICLSGRFSTTTLLWYRCSC